MGRRWPDDGWQWSCVGYAVGQGDSVGGCEQHCWSWVDHSREWYNVDGGSRCSCGPVCDWRCGGSGGNGLHVQRVGSVGWLFMRRW